MIVECPGCKYHYDVSKYRAGEHLRCRCGQILAVPPKGLLFRKVNTLYCSNCGGALEKGNSYCPYCSSLVDLTSARLNAYCPHCLAHSPESARYCSGCSKPLIELLEMPKVDGHCCPRCKIQMRERFIAGFHPLECPVCCGIFVNSDDFESLLSSQLAQSTRQEPSSGPEQSRLESESVSYIPCPFCEQRMNRVNYDQGSGVIIDYCAAHGYWLDAGEIEKVARWVGTGGTIRLYAANSKSKRFGTAARPSLSTEKPIQNETETFDREEQQKRFDREEQQKRFEGADIIDVITMMLLGR